MRLLDRYQLRELLVALGFCLAGFLIFWISFDLISELEEFQDAHLKLGEILQYYCVKIPDFLVTVIPIALLLALLYALTHHSRHQEITAMRAAGISLWRLSAPYFAIGLVSSAAVFALNEKMAVSSSEAAGRLLDRGNKESARWQVRINFRNARDDRTWNIAAFNLDSFEMINPQLEWNLPDGSSRRIIARRAYPTNGTWLFESVVELVYPSGRRFDPAHFPPPIRTNALEVPGLTETPEQILSEIKLGPLLNGEIKPGRKVAASLAELRDYCRLHPDLNRRDRAILRTQFQARLAEPWTSLVVVCIALPFGISSGRRDVFVGVAGSIFICFAFFLLVRLALALGTGGYIPPVLAAWLPNLLFGGLGLALTWRAG